MSISESATTAAHAASLPVMVLAHNEQRNIVACLDSIVVADPALDLTIYVLANGCTDRTEDLVREYSRRRPQVHLVSIALADKCNAWNVFIHDFVPAHCPDREIYFFMDGDARVVPASFSAMARALRTHAPAHAASAVPASGRNAAHYRETILHVHGLVANLYALRGTFVERLRALSVRLPLTLEGDDGLIGALVKWDLAPETQEFDDERIVPCADAAFEFDALSLWRPSDWQACWKRAVRYGRRHYENQLLGPDLSARGLAGLPTDITELYPRAASLSLRWNGLYTLTNLIALCQMRRHPRIRPL